MNRRELIKSCLAAPLLAPLAWSQPGKARQPLLKLSCNLFTFNEPLSKGTMTLAQVIDYCAELGFEAVDPTGYYFPGYPAAPPDSAVNEVKRQAFMLGLDISGTGVRNNFVQADAAKRKADIELVKLWVGVSLKLGAPVLRVFAGRQDEGHSAAEIDKWLVDCLAECAQYAGRHGVLLALQNHRDFIDTAEHLNAVITKVGSPWLRAHLDIGGFRTDDPYKDIEEAIPNAINWQIKENVFVRDEATPTDLPKLFAIIRRGGYRGYIPLETLGAGDPREKMPRFLARVREALG